MSPSKHQKSGSVRIEHSLNKKENEFVFNRRKYILQSLKKLHIYCSEDEVPNIALLGSGGGERAMVGLLGSLDQIQKIGLLDCVLYLSGVSGSTWCMASLYQESDWSTKLETVKDEIIQRLSGPAISWKDAYDKLEKYYEEKDIFSLTDVWAVMFITTYLKEIDEHTLSDQWDQQSKDPFPIYTVIDKHSKQRCREARGAIPQSFPALGKYFCRGIDALPKDPWFEFTPYEAGYSLTGAFVETSKFGSKFKNGRKIKNQPEIDMLYLQALCGSALADGDEDIKFLWELIKDFFHHFLLKRETGMFEELSKEDKCLQVLMDLVDMNLSVLNGIDPSALDESIRTKLNELTEGKHQLKKLILTDKEAAKQYMKQNTEDVCHDLSRCGNFWSLGLWMSIIKCMAQWTWGRNYDFLHNMKDKAVPAALLQSETRDYIDGGLLLNSPYFSVLREERKIDLIISLDFSDGDPFTTVRGAAETCKKLNIPFPEVNVPIKDIKKPKDFYVFKGQNTPTVIHIPLFNVVNCGDDFEECKAKYQTFQGPYSAEMIPDLVEIAGKNITNNKHNLLEQIRLAIQPKNTQNNE